MKHLHLQRQHRNTAHADASRREVPSSLPATRFAARPPTRAPLRLAQRRGQRTLRTHPRPARLAAAQALSRATGFCSAMSGLQKADPADRPFAATATPDAMKFPMTTTEERHANEITARERGGVVRVGKAGRKTAG